MSMMEIKITTGHVPEEAKKLRQDVFVTEQGFTDEFDEFDCKSTHFVLFSDDGPAATLRFYDEGGGSVHVGRVAVKKEYRGAGLGRLLMNEAFSIASAMGYEKMTVGAQEDKSGFYERCGFKVCGEKYFEQDYPHLPMEKLLEGVGE